MSRIVISCLLVCGLALAVGCEKKPTAPAPVANEPVTSAPPIVDTNPPGPIYTPTTPPPIDTPSASGARTYTVKPGDSLIKIAREQLGDEHRLNDLKKANPEVKPPLFSIKPGQIIKLPAK